MKQHVQTDSSTPGRFEIGRAALPHAATVAEKFVAVIVLLIALGPLREPSMVGRRIVRSAEEASAQSAQTYLEGMVAGLRERGLPVHTQTVEGKPYLEIVRHADDGETDLTAMSTRGHSGPSRLSLGASPTGRYVAQRSRCWFSVKRSLTWATTSIRGWA